MQILPTTETQELSMARDSGAAKVFKQLQVTCQIQKSSVWVLISDQIHLLIGSQTNLHV